MNNLLGDRTFLRKVTIIHNRLNCGLPVSDEDLVLLRKWVEAVKEEDKLSPITIVAVLLIIVGCLFYLARVGS